MNFEHMCLPKVHKKFSTWVSGVALKIARDKRWTQPHGLGSPVAD
jgi:hypothetical protein